MAERVYEADVYVEDPEDERVYEVDFQAVWAVEANIGAGFSGEPV